MNTKLLILFNLILISLIPSFLWGQDMFCYRDDMGMLNCSKSMDQIPSQYRGKAFFKQDPINSNNTRSARPTHVSRDTQEDSTPHFNSAPSTQLPPPLPAQSNLPSRQRPEDEEAKEISNDNDYIPSPDFPKTTREVILPNNLPKAAEEQKQAAPEPKAPQEIKPALEAKPSKFEANKPSVLEPARVKSPVANAPSQQPKIEIFVAKWCPHCRSLEDFLKLQKLKFTKYDVEEDAYGIEVFNNEGGGIPITKIGDSTIVGYDEKKFKAIIDSKIPY